METTLQWTPPAMLIFLNGRNGGRAVRRKTLKDIVDRFFVWRLVPE